MKIVYDDKQELYFVTLEEPEGVLCINTNDIVECKKYFLEDMESLFNRTVCEQFIER